MSVYVCMCAGRKKGRGNVREKSIVYIFLCVCVCLCPINRKKQRKKEGKIQCESETDCVRAHVSVCKGNVCACYLIYWECMCVYACKTICYVLTFDPAQKMLFQGDAPERSDTFQWQLGEEIAWAEIGWWNGDKVLFTNPSARTGYYTRSIFKRRWDKVIPMVHYRVMYRKRVTSELHDSYFRLMTIKHSISKIEWASNDYIIQLSSTSQWQLSWRSDEMW